MTSRRSRLLLLCGALLVAVLAAGAIYAEITQAENARKQLLAQTQLIARLAAAQLEIDGSAADPGTPGADALRQLDRLVEAPNLRSAELLSGQGRVLLRRGRASPHPATPPQRDTPQDGAALGALDQRSAVAWAALSPGGQAGWLRIEVDAAGPGALRASMLWAAALLLAAGGGVALFLARPGRPRAQAADVSSRLDAPTPSPVQPGASAAELSHLEKGLEDAALGLAERSVALRVSEQRFEHVLAMLTERVFEVDLDLLTVYLNPAWARFKEQPLETLIGMPLPELLDAEREPQVRARLCALANQPQGGSIEIAVAAADGETAWLELSLQPRFDDGRLVGYTGRASDISARKRIDDERRAAKRVVEESNRMKSTFLANMSHELRTPMNAIIGMSDLVLESDLDSEQRQLLTNARTAADNLLGIINDLLDFSKIETGRLDFEQIPFGIRDCVAHAVASHRESALSKGLLIDCRIDPSVPDALEGDPHRLRQVLQNLIGNGVKFTERGHVVIRVSSVSVSATACVLRFSVKDTGIGIPAAEQERVFEAFSQADSSVTRRYGGTGLGLSVANRLVERMGGRMVVVSAPGEGSTFLFTARFARPGERADFAGAVPLDSLRIMIAGESAFENGNLAQTLAGWQMRPEAESQGERLLERLRHASSSDTPFHVIVLGDRLADMSAFEFARRLRADPAIQSPAVILAASGGQRGDAAQCRQIGINAYLTRPLHPLDLLDAILLAVARRRDGQLITRHSLRENRRSLQILLAARADYPFISRQLERLGHVVHRADNGVEAIESCRAASFDVVLLDGLLGSPDAITVLIRLRALDAGEASSTPVIALVPDGHGELGASLEAAGADVLLCSPPATVALVAALRRLGDASKAPPTAPGTSAAAPRTTLKVFDAARAREYLDHDDDLLRELIRVYLDGDPSLRKRLREALVLGDLRAAHAAVHSIAGSVGSFMAESALAATAKIEAHCREGEVGDLDEDLALLWQELDKLADALRETLHAAPDPAVAGSPQALR